MTRSATAWPSDLSREEAARQRADGRIDLAVERLGGRTAVARLGEAGSARVRLPREPNSTAVLINTAGGLAAGDHFATRVAVGEGADLTVTSAAAEKIYKSDTGAETRIQTHLALDAGSRLDWLPQEAILFNRGRVSRRMDVSLAGDARLLAFEAAVFGRAARGEHVDTGLWQDRWRVRRDGRLVYADTLRLDGAMAEILSRPTMAAGARALATVLYVAPDAPARLDDLRASLDGARSDVAAGSWNGMLLARCLAPDIETLRRDAARVITCLSSRALPRVWQT